MKRRLFFVLSALLTVGLTFGMSNMPRASATVLGTNVLVSYNSTNSGPSTSNSNSMANISEDGSIVVFYSGAHDIVSGVTSGLNLYLRNLKTNTTTLVNKNLAGTPANLSSTQGMYFGMSRTGRYVAYISSATNIVSSPVVSSGSLGHAYVVDTQLGTTALVDQSSTGVVGNGGAATSGAMITGISDDGRLVYFLSQSTNLLASGNPTAPNYAMNAYIKDMQSGTVIDATASGSGVRANATTGAIFNSCEGSILSFGSNATNLSASYSGYMDTFVADFRMSHKVTNITPAANGDSQPVGMSCNGRYVTLYSKATNLTADSVSGTINHMFRYDRITGTFELIDKSASGYISSSYTGTAQMNNYSGRNVSDDGKVIFWDNDTNVVTPAAASQYEVYLRNPEAGTTELIPINSSGVEQSPAYTHPRLTLAISSDGKNVLYDSVATNLVPGITTGWGSAGYIVLSKV